jgi:hypothetical protein
MVKVNVHALMDQAIVAAVDEYAAANGISRAAALSILIRRGLQAEEKR